MKNQSAISLYNNLCSTEIGVADGEECAVTTKFGILMLGQDCKLFLPYRIRIGKEQDLPENASAEQIKSNREGNEKTRARNEEARSDYIKVAKSLRAWADAIEEIIHANA